MHRICQITSAAKIGGGELHLLLLARYLHGTEFDFHFIVPETGPFCNKLQQVGIPYRVVPMGTKFQFGARNAIRGILKESNTSLAHCHGARANWYGRSAAKRAGTPVVFCTTHNSLKDYPYPHWRRRLYVTVDRRTAGLVNQWIAVSDAIRNDLVDYYGIPATKIETIPNGIDPRDLKLVRTREQVRKDLRLSQDSFVLIAIARMTQQKGHRFLLEAVTHLRDRIPKLRCLLAGDGPLRPSLELQVKQLHIQDCVHFLGFRTDVADLINTADIYVLPSLSEGMPMGILEAMALGCPVVASAVNGVPELVCDQVNGLLVPPADVAALTQALEKLCVDSDLRQNLGDSARNTVQRQFTAKRMAERVAQLYRKHLNELALDH